ncbi:MAG: hypothetical protein CMM50_15720 [Rhodospirillaceae bacterium]|nr:hypothetical protein [Rhodospirillaceae bacterium]|tara:strand:+ start:133 stop:621 length:489 start_codon:yes stop_codon:yes gene_type:complete
MLGRLSDAADRVVLIVSVALVLAMLGVSIAGITHQALLGEPLVWSYSLARLFLPWVAMLSITVALKRGEHVALTFLVIRLPSSARRLCAWIGVVVLALFAAALIWFGTTFFLGATQLYMVSGTIQVSTRWMAASVPVAGLVLALHALAGPRLMALQGSGAET